MTTTAKQGSKNDKELSSSVFDLVLSNEAELLVDLGVEKSDLKRGLTAEGRPYLGGSTNAAPSGNALSPSTGQGEQLGNHDGERVQVVTVSSVEEGGYSSGLAPPRLLTTTRGGRCLLPGAFAQDGPGMITEGTNVNNSVPLTESSNTSNDHVVGWDSGGSNEAGLAVANLVEEDSEFFRTIPMAQPEVNPSTGERGTNGEEPKTMHSEIKALLGILVVLMAVLGLFVVLVITTNKSAESSDSDMPPAVTATDLELVSTVPSQAPTSIVDSLFALLPTETTIKILEEPVSPQSRAFDWLMEGGIETLSYFSDSEILQKFILATFYYSTDGDNWAKNTHWLNHSIHECNWHIEGHFAMTDTLSKLYVGYLENFFPSPPTPCNEHGLYEHLWLDTNNLHGSLPEELFLLSSLKTFSVGYNILHGSLSSSVAQLTDLEGLLISEMADAGSIPSELGLMTKLRCLALINNDHTGYFPNELWQLSKLDTLLMGGNPELKGTISTQVGAMSDLRFLFFDKDDLSGSIPTEIGLATSLEWLVLYMNQMTGTTPTELGQLSKLRLLSLWENQLSGTVPKELGDLSSLFLLSIRDNLLSGPVPSELGLLTNLSVILYLHANHLTGTIPTELGELSLLIGLYLDSNDLTGQIPSEFGRLESMEKLRLANNSLSGTLPVELAQLKERSLHTLALQGNPLLSGTIPGEICSLNATCVGHHLATEHCIAPYGVSFDCTESLCGCGCNCTTQG